VLDQVGSLHLGNLLECGQSEDAGIGDDGVDVADVVRGEAADGLLCVCLRCGFNFDEDNFAARGGRQFGKSLGLGGVWITDGADDGGVGT